MNDDTQNNRRKIINSEEDTHADFLTRPEVDENNMPRPPRQRITERDVEGTRVTPAAYKEPTTSSKRVNAPRPQKSAPKKPPFRLQNSWGCLTRGFIISLFGAIVFGLCGASIFIYQYFSIANTLPEIGDLRQRASQFETTRILDRNGSLLYEILDPNAGRRTYIPLEEISPYLLAATIATEDKDFYTHPGFDLYAMTRALWQNYRSGGTVSGASTITQQLARALLLSADERVERSYTRKAREIILATEITRRYSKDDILELYLNEIYYGNLAYGIEAAAETYFGKSAKDLTLSEASFLAGLPQSPAVYDIHTNREVTLIRQQQVLVLMFELSNEKNCITVSNSLNPICVDATSAANAASELKVYNFIPLSFDAKYPHWVMYIRKELEKLYDAQTIYRSGFTVYTTLDPKLQDEAQRLVTEQVAALADKNAHNGALIAIRPSTGEILAMVGSPDFNNVAISGQINMTDSPTRQPGSSIKPLTYVAAFEKGWTPATLIWDVPTDFPDGANPPYVPNNYDGKFHGPVTVRVALSNSFNIPAVKALQFVGIKDDPNTPEKDGFIPFAEKLGITTLTRDDYGFSLTLGGGDVSLLEMAGAYSVFANQGQRVVPVAILKIEDFQHNVVFEYQPVQGEQVIRAEHAYLISSILSDNNARSWMFGTGSVLNLPFPAAAKTGTTNDFRDNWTMGYTPDLVAGVWVGNADYTPMVNTTGTSGAAPIWSQFMQFAVPYLTNGAPTAFNRPAGIMDVVVCRLSGAQPSSFCHDQISEVFASDQAPLKQGQDLIRKIDIDLWTGLEASEVCNDFTDSENVLDVDDEWARKWFNTDDGRNWLEAHGLGRKPVYAPERECTKDDPHPEIEFNMKDAQTIISNSLEIKGTVSAKGGIKAWVLEYGLGAEPTQWSMLNEGKQEIENGILHTWDLNGIPNGLVTLRIRLTSGYGEISKTIKLNIDIPLPTTIPTFTPSATATLQPTDMPTLTPTETVTPSFTPTQASTATETPTALP